MIGESAPDRTVLEITGTDRVDFLRDWSATTLAG